MLAQSLVLMSVAVLCGLGCLSLLLVSGAKNSAAEEEYRARYWEDTPTTEGGLPRSADEGYRWRTESDSQEMKRAA